MVREINIFNTFKLIHPVLIVQGVLKFTDFNIKLFALTMGDDCSDSMRVLHVKEE